MGYSLPSSVPSIVLGKNLVVATCRNIDFYSVDGEKVTSIECSKSIIRIFGNGNDILGVATRDVFGQAGIQFFKNGKEFGTSLENAADHEILAADITQDGLFCVFVSGLPKYCLKVANLNTGKTILEKPIDVVDLRSIQINPSANNQFLVHRKNSVTQFTIENFDENRCTLSEKEVSFNDLMDGTVNMLSQRTENLWNHDVDELPLNFEIERQKHGEITSALWKDSKILLSTSHGEIYMIRQNGDSDDFLVSDSEYKNVATLVMENFIPCADGIQAMALNNDELVLLGEDGVFLLGQEKARKQKGKVIKTLKQISSTSFQNVCKCSITSESNALVEYYCGKREIINLKDCSRTLQFFQSSSKIISSAIASDKRIVISRDSNTLELYESTLKRCDVLQVDSKVLTIASTATENIFFLGTECGCLVALKVDTESKKLFLIAAKKLFSQNLTSIAVDTYNRALIVGSSSDDKILALSWKNATQILPEVMGFLPVDGVVKNLSVSASSSSTSLVVLASLAERSTSPEIDALLAFELAHDIFTTPHLLKHVNNLLELDQKSVNATMVMIPPCSRVTLLSCVNGVASCWAVSSVSATINQLEFTLGKEYKDEISFVRQLSQWPTSSISFAAPFHNFWVAQACRSGTLTLIRNITKKIQLPTSDKTYELRFDRNGENLLVYSENNIELVGLSAKSDFIQKAFVLGKGAKALPSLSDAQQIKLASDEEDWFAIQVKIAAEIEDLKYKTIKGHFSDDLSQLRNIVEQMMKENDEADELEKLDNQEFNLDKKQVEEMAEKEVTDIAALKKEIADKITDYGKLVDSISDSCWKNMESGARSLKGFYLPLAVKNFEIRPTSQEFASLYEKAKTEREAERENEPAQKEMKSSETSMDENEPGIHKFGSVTDQLIGEDPLLASQFSLIKTHSRVREMTLIEQRVKLIKSHFNKQFDAVFRQKQNEIAKIGEKNERISEISRDTGVEFELLRPQLDDSERTELVFEVEDEEVEVERVLTEEQQALLDEQRRQEEERKANKGDNARDRALLEMMDGVLEVKSEDVLKIDVPRPAFMDDADKHESDWTDEEVKQAREYDKKCVALEEERTKFKKSLEIEAKKTQQGIVEGMHAFDLTIQELNQKRLIAQMAVNQEYLRIGRILRGLTWEEEALEIDNLIKELINELQNTVKEKKKYLDEFKRFYDEAKEELDDKVNDDKITEKSFKNEFEESNVFVDQLFKAYRRRPKQDETMADLDNIEEAPTGVEEEDWTKTITLREEKMRKEAIIRHHQQIVAVMREFLSLRASEDAKLQERVSELLTESNTHELEIKNKTKNLLIQILLKQGQVEVNPGKFLTDYTEAQFIHRETVEDMNSEIKQFGTAKIEAMIESADFRKGIHSLEWERRKLEMEKDDLIQKTQDIQLLKLTRELQAVLLSGNLGQNKTNQDLARLDRNLKAQNEQHKSKMARKNKEAKKLSDRKSALIRENAHLDGIIEELLISVSEKRNIKNGQIMPDTGKIMRNHARNRQLAEIVKRQHNEISVLKQEVERLRKKTFPALLKVQR